MAPLLLLSAIHSVTKNVIIEKMKANGVASCGSDDHSSQWELYKKATTAVKNSQVSVLLLPIDLLIKSAKILLKQIIIANYAPECILILVNRK